MLIKRKNNPPNPLNPRFIEGLSDATLFIAETQRTQKKTAGSKKIFYSDSMRKL
jgi:hypothetical protein